MAALTHSPDASAPSDDASTTPATAPSEERPMTGKHQSIAEWHGKDLAGDDMRRVGTLADGYADGETDEPMFGTVKEGLFAHHLTFVPGSTTRRRLQRADADSPGADAPRTVGQ